MPVSTFLKHFNSTFKQEKPWRLRLLPCAAKRRLTTMMHTKQSPQVYPLQPSGKTAQPGGIGRHSAHGCVSQLNCFESDTQSLYSKSSCSRYGPEYLRKIESPFRNETRINTSTPWDKYLWQWGPATQDSTPWESSTLGWSDNLHPMRYNILPPQESDPYQYTSSTVLA